MPSIKNKAQKARFGIVGAINTILDFGILFALTTFGLGSIASNYISTSVAFAFSFFANRNYTFKTAKGNLRRQVILFTAVTLFGLWFIQPLVIWSVSEALSSFTIATWITLFVAKVVATIASLIWNYILYSRLVFTK